MNIVIIGGTSGIGRELGVQYAEAGNHVFITGRRRTMLQELSAFSDRITAVHMDITDENSLRQGLQEINSKADRFDLAIVCAGVGELNPDLCYEINAETIQTNVVGWTCAVDNLFQIFERQGRGHLAVITSLNALRGEPASPAYSASKAYQSNYTEALCKKAHKSGLPIHVTEIRPGLVDSAMAKGDGLFWVMPVEKVARQIRRAIQNKVRLQTVTRRWCIIAFIMRRLPWCIYRSI